MLYFVLDLSSQELITCVEFLLKERDRHCICFFSAGTPNSFLQERNRKSIQVVIFDASDMYGNPPTKQLVLLLYVMGYVEANIYMVDRFSLAPETHEPASIPW
jgi:hypothetical protein